nr:hypothetical protein [Tanacetum cinerariifolium]
TNTFDNSLLESENFCFDLKEISSGSTTIGSDISLPDYEAFYDDHVKEISSGSTTTHSDFSLYDSFIFDLSINPFPPADRSDFYHEEFTDELAHIISLPEYDCFCFKNEPNSRDFTMDVVEDTFPTREPRVHVHNVLPIHPTLHLNLDSILSSESLFAYFVWIFLPFLSYSVAPQYLLSFRNKDTIFDPGISIIHSFMPTPKDSEDDGNGEEDQGLRISEEERIHEEEEADELYRMESIFTTASSSVAPLPSPTSTMTPSIITITTTASQPPIPPTPIPSEVLQNFPTFKSVFRFKDRVKSLEVNFSEFMRTNQFPEDVSNIPDRLQDSLQRENDEFLRTIDDNMKKIIKEQAVAADLSEIELKKILIDKMEGNKSIQRSDEQRNLYKALVEAYEADKTILDSYGESTILKRRRKDDDDQEGPSAGSDWGSKRRREGREHASANTPSEPATRSAGRSTTGTQSRQLSASESAFAKEPVQTICQMEEASHLVFKTGAEDQPIVQTSQHPEWFSQPRKPPTPDRDWNKTLPVVQRNAQSWISELAKQTDARSSFNELLDTPIDFSNFIMNRLGVDTLTPERLAGPTYELMRGSCNSLTELEYHLEEFYGFAVNWESALDVYSKRRIIAVTDLKIVKWHNYNHLDWILGIRMQYLPTTIWRNGDKDRAAAMIQAIDKMLKTRRIMRSLERVRKGFCRLAHLAPQCVLSFYTYNPCGVHRWSLKFCKGLHLNWESARDVYSKRRIIAVTELQIVEWHNYKHLDWITVRRDDDKLYKFKEGDFKRLRIQDIKDMLLLLGIRMKYLPQAIWRKRDKERAAAMIQAIDKQLKTRRIMRSLEKFVGGRLAIESINHTLAHKAAKRRKLKEEAKEVKDLKQHLEIVPDEDDDVYTEATPLARKVPIVDYQIILVNNKPRYKIIKVDGTHQLYTSFITMLKNFDRDDLENLWSIVKERFSTSKPNNFSDEYLLTTLKTMFGRPDRHDNVWKSQRSVRGQALVKSWKLLTSCGVHIISFTTTQIILLVERRYVLSKFTLE